MPRPTVKKARRPGLAPGSRRSADRPARRRSSRRRPVVRGGTWGIGLVAILSAEPALFLETEARRGDSLTVLAHRLCGDAQKVQLLADANGGKPEVEDRRPLPRRPTQCLTPEYQLKVAKALFPDDKPQADGWHHLVRGVGALQRESLWHIAVWFTGNGENFRSIREYNDGDRRRPGARAPR